MEEVTVMGLISQSAAHHANPAGAVRIAAEAIDSVGGQPSHAVGRIHREMIFHHLTTLLLPLTSHLQDIRPRAVGTNAHQAVAKTDGEHYLPYAVNRMGLLL